MCRSQLPTEPPPLPRRKKWPKRVVDAVRSRSGGKCEAVGCENDGREINHKVPSTLGGKSTLENAELLCPPCHRKLTNLHAKLIAKSNRVRKATYTKKDAQPHKKRLQSRGFDRTVRKKMDGSVERKID